MGCGVGCWPVCAQEAGGCQLPVQWGGWGGSEPRVLGAPEASGPPQEAVSFPPCHLASPPGSGLRECHGP